MKTGTGCDLGTPSRLKLFCALSRTPHGLIDMATPWLSALLWLGSFPPIEKIALGILTAFSGYTAVYALNDIVDYRVDREKMQGVGLGEGGSDLDAVFMRHPLAQGFLSLKEGILWMGAWAVLALLGAYLLNPICAVIFLTACLIEAGYCLLLKVSHWRTLMSGFVKTSGGMAAVFAVDPNPDLLFLILLFLWLFFWEIGGQNVPNDWVDLEEDRALRAKTIPTLLGSEGSMRIILFSLVTTVILSLLVPWGIPQPTGLIYWVGAFLVGFYSLLLPAYHLRKSKSPQQAGVLFNRASYYPLAMFLVIVMSMIKQ